MKDSEVNMVELILENYPDEEFILADGFEERTLQKDY